MNSTSDETAIRGLVDEFVEGWNAGNGEMCGRPFAKDAEFTAITGLRARGRDLIARGHSEILSTIYCGTQITGTVNSINILEARRCLRRYHVSFCGIRAVRNYANLDGTCGNERKRRRSLANRCVPEHGPIRASARRTA
jgi:hypothetical protein